MVHLSKLIFVIVDALGYDAATAKAGYLEHMVEAGLAAKYRVRGELPAVSRPMYETLLTGLPVCRHLVTSNDTVRPSKEANLFSLTKENGLINAAAAYMWMWELYGAAKEELPFQLFRDRIHINEQKSSLMNGIFYGADEYPDSHLFADGEYLRRTVHPDFLMIHSMQVDYQGHRFGACSAEYENAIVGVTDCMAQLVPAWLEDGYDVVVTGDHGMDTLHQHCGNTELQRYVPLYIISNRVTAGYHTNEVSMLEIAPLLCRLLCIKPSQEMSTDQNIRGINV